MSVSFPPFWVCPPLFCHAGLFLIIFFFWMSKSSRDDVRHNITTIKILSSDVHHFGLAHKEENVQFELGQRSGNVEHIFSLSQKKKNIPKQNVFLSFPIKIQLFLLKVEMWSDYRVTANDTRTGFSPLKKKKLYAQNKIWRRRQLLILLHWEKKKKIERRSLVCEIICRVTQTHLRRIKKPRQVKEDKCPSLRVVASWFRARSQLKVLPRLLIA